jgi:MtrB/PioB family decaheme-associated outer membrane protein
MKKAARNGDCSLGVLARAVQLALLALLAAPGWAAAQSAAPADAKTADQKDEAGQQEQAAGSKEASQKAADDDVFPSLKSLICPTSFIDLGATNVPKSAPQFGQYNGMAHSGVYGIAGFGVAGGGCQNASLLRWDAYGSNLATTSRNLGADIEQQGLWSIGLNFDQLRHYTTTGFQTPYQGSLGGNTFTLPSSFGYINTGTNGGSQSLTAAQLAAFHGLDVYSERKNTSFSASYAFNTEWNAKLDWKHIDRDGAKLIGGGGDQSTLDGIAFAGQTPALRLNPTNDTTDNVTAQLNWAGKQSYATIEYYGSLYQDNYNGMSFANPFVTGSTATGAIPAGGFWQNTMSTPPSNLLNQINVSGGHFFSQATRLTGGFSLGLNTQNDSFDGTYTPGTVAGLPATSLHGRVITSHADVRLTHKISKELGLNTGLRYDERNNTTQVNTYSFTNIAGTSGITPTTTPESYRHTVYDAALDYRVAKDQKLTFGYTYDHMQRWCNSWLSNNAQGSLPANAAGYYVTNSCVQVPDSTDNTLKLNYKLTAWDPFSFNLGYSYADRNDTINPSFYNPMQSMTNGQGFENYGWLAYFQAPRKEQTFKARADWQITKRLDLGLTGQYVLDNYYDSTLGVQSGHAGNVELDANFQATDDVSLGAYLSVQKRSRYLLSSSVRSPVTPVTTLWDNTLQDNDYAVGLNGKQKFLDDKFQLTEDLSYDLGRSLYNTDLLAGIAPATGNSGQMPISNKTIQLRVVGSYDMSKTSRVSLGYLFARLMGNDYFYNAYAYGYTPSTVMPANQQTPRYTINVLYLVYRYTFPQ